MLSKVLKIAGGVILGAGVYEVGKLFLNISYAAGFQEGELTQLSILSKLDNLCDGMSYEYVRAFELWRDGYFDTRPRASDVRYKEPFRTRVRCMDSAISRDRAVVKRINLDDNKVVNRVHQWLLRNWFDGVFDDLDEDTEIVELRFKKSNDIPLDKDILTELAVKYNVAYLDKGDTFGFVGLHDNVHTFGDNFWTNYTLTAMERDKPGIPIGRYTPNNITSEDC